MVLKKHITHRWSKGGKSELIKSDFCEEAEQVSACSSLISIKAHSLRPPRALSEEKVFNAKLAKVAKEEERSSAAA